MQSLKNRAKDATDMIFGITPDGEVLHKCLSEMPHLLIAGTTGSGKSVLLNQLIITSMQHSTPDEICYAMIDPKKVEFKRYADSPYMLVNPIVEVQDSLIFLKYLVIEMGNRYEMLAEVNVRNIESYNKWAKKNNEKIMKYIVVTIDEFSALIMQDKTVEDDLIQLAQMARACGIHINVATQSPRATVITGLMKANFPSRCSLMVASGLESGIILDEQGAENLGGNGDGLLKLKGGEIYRFQAGYISDEEIDDILNYQRAHYPKAETLDYKKIVADSLGEEGEGIEKEITLPKRPQTKRNEGYIAKSNSLSNFQKKRLYMEENGFKAPSLKELRKNKMDIINQKLGGISEDKPNVEVRVVKTINTNNAKKESTSPLMKKSSSPLMGMGKKK